MQCSGFSLKIQEFSFIKFNAMQCISVENPRIVIILSLFYEIKEKSKTKFKLKYDVVHQISVGNPFFKIFFFIYQKTEKQLKRKRIFN